jgi:4-amino-4-deoxy-L-arabinose transferase-like glycosyltransferase
MWVTIPVLVSFQPMFTFMGAVVNQDILLVATCSWATYWLVLIVRSGFTVRRAMGLGFALGLGVLAKPQVWFLIPSVAVVTALEFLYRKVGARRLLLLLTVSTVVCLAVCGWSLIRNQVLNKSIFYNPRRNTPNPDVDLAQFLWEYENRLNGSLFRSYWGRFGWLDTDLRQWDYYLVRFAVRLAWLGLGIYVARKVWARQPLTGTSRCLLVQGVYGATFVLAFAVLGFWIARRTGGTQPKQGRYFLAALVSQMTLLAVGLLALVPERWQRAGHLALQAAMVLLNISALFGALIPRYYVL